MGKDKSRLAKTTDRGYGWKHQQERKKWARIIDTGAAVIPCARCGETIKAGTKWELGHTEDRSRYSGPEHFLCNRQAGGKKGAEIANSKRNNYTREW